MIRPRKQRHYPEHSLQVSIVDALREALPRPWLVVASKNGGRPNCRSRKPAPRSPKPAACLA